MSNVLNDEALEHYPFATSELPAQWFHVSLDEIAAEINPGFASGKHTSDGIGIPHLRPMNVDRNGQIDLSVVKSVTESKGIELKAGDILFNNTNSAELIGKTAVISARENGFAFSNHMTRIRLETGILPSYISRQLHFLWMTGYFRHRCTNHVNQASISSKTLSGTIPVLLPPLNEQTRIVEKLEELLSDLDAGVAELKAAQKKLVQYRQSLLKAAVEGALTAEWRTFNQPKETGTQLLERILIERRARWEAKQLAKFKEQGKAPPKDWQNKYPEPVKPDTSDLPELPDGWVWASLDCLISDGPQNGIYLPANLYGSGTSILRIDDYQIGWHRSRENLNLVNADYSAVLTYSLSLGDLVINRVNSMTHLGKCLLIRKELVGALFESNMMRLHLSGNANEIFFSLYLGSHIGRARLIKNAKWAVNQASINQEDVKIAPIPLPSFEEQVEISSVLLDQMNGLDAQLRTIEMSLKQSAAQRKNILKAAFSGQLVPQDPNDEPAIVLLERIRAEREQQKKQPKIKNSRKSTGMKKSNLNNVRDWIESKPDASTFNFSDLSNGLPGDYETLKDSLFQLLAEDKPIIEQGFDRKTSSLQFKRVKS